MVEIPLNAPEESLHPVVCVCLFTVDGVEVRRLLHGGGGFVVHIVMVIFSCWSMWLTYLRR